ncbi:hypothetical protein SDC9_208727 [bioreactor metagenome]|uniref:Uncharacterized protein n=1 Tax=bioreactor metagenome TaxID=1076179 RepID=A0A645JN08_9ZZZZ
MVRKLLSIKRKAQASPMNDLLWHLYHSLAIYAVSLLGVLIIFPPHAKQSSLSPLNKITAINIFRSVIQNSLANIKHTVFYVKLINLQLIMKELT